MTLKNIEAPEPNRCGRCGDETNRKTTNDIDVFQSQIGNLIGGEICDDCLESLIKWWND